MLFFSRLNIAIVAMRNNRKGCVSQKMDYSLVRSMVVVQPSRRCPWLAQILRSGGIATRNSFKDKELIKRLCNTKRIPHYK
jgi:hypothetical protein